jgi:ribosomal protein S12 methylthiotransferase
MELQRENVARMSASRVGTTCATIIEGVSEDGFFYLGRTAAEAPDIDPIVSVTSEVPLEMGAVVPVTMLFADGYDMVGQAVTVPEPEMT